MATKSEGAKAELNEHSVALDPTSGQEQDSIGSGQADDEASTTMRSRGRKDQCQVENCMVDLTKEGKAYCIKRRLCIEHMRADEVKCRGQEGLFRFCFQCGKLEPLACFEGMKRSCRVRLAQRKQREARRCNSDVGHIFNRSQQNLLGQQQLAKQRAHTGNRFAGILPDFHDELLPLHLHALDCGEEVGDWDQQQQAVQLLPMINPAYMMAPGRHPSVGSSSAGFEGSASHSMPLPIHLSDGNTTAVGAGMSGGLLTQGSFTQMSFMENTVAGDGSCCKYTGYATQRQQWRQQQLQAVQMQQQHGSPCGMSVPLPSVSESAVHDPASGCVSGPIPAWMGVGISQGMSGLTGPPGVSGSSGPQLGQAAAAAVTSCPAAIAGSVSAPLPCLMVAPLAPNQSAAAAVAAHQQAADFGLDADLLHECLMHLSTDSNAAGEGLPYSDTDLRSLLEGALETATHSQQQPAPQQQQQPQGVAMVNASVIAAGTSGQSLCSNQTRLLQCLGSTGKTPAAPLRSLSFAGTAQQPQQLPRSDVSAATAPLPSISEQGMSKAAVLQQLHRIRQEQMVLLQELHMQETASNCIFADASAAAAVGSVLRVTEDVLQARLESVQQQYTQMLLEVQKIKHMNQMGLGPAAASCINFEL